MELLQRCKNKCVQYKQKGLIYLLERNTLGKGSLCYRKVKNILLILFFKICFEPTTRRLASENTWYVPGY